MAVEPNPFRMPTDEEVFVLRDEERRHKALERERLKYKKVYEKTTWSTRIGSAKTKTKVDDLDITKEARAEPKYSPPPLAATAPQQSTRPPANHMTAFIAKKREMGLQRMSLATKRGEIKILDEEADSREKRIQQLEEQLDETERKFDDFMKHNEMEQVDAEKKSQNETKLKQEKAQEIKKLNSQILQIEMERKRIEEQLNVCMRFKRDLDQLTPEKWFRDTLTKIKVEDSKKKLEEDLAQKVSDSEEATEAQLLTLRQELDEVLKNSISTIHAQVHGFKKDEVIAILDQMDPDRVPMYFTDHNTILNIFVEIEEANLFLINNCQEMEEGLDSLRSTFTAEKARMDAEADNLKLQINSVKQKIAMEESKKKALLERMEKAKVLTKTVVKKEEEQKEITLEELKTEIETLVTTIFKRANLGGDEGSSTVLSMLTQIETKLEELRTAISNEKEYPPEFVADVLKKRDKLRRQAARQKLLDLQRIAREKRSEQALKRSQAPVQKRVGKPVMWRSKPNDIRRLDLATEDTNQANDEDEFLQ